MSSQQAPRPTPIPYRQPAPQGQQLAASPPPPSKQALRSWWGKFKKSTEGNREIAAVESSPGIFGIPLRKSIPYANVAISLVDLEGKSYIYGYVPIIVAKCGVYLKEKATNVEGIFRLSGSEKRIKELVAIFDSPPRYGKGLDWDGYTVHDAANVLRRYLNQLPEPIVPLDVYSRFREPLRGHVLQAVGDKEGQEVSDGFDLEATIKLYQKLITDLPPLNTQLLLYILDLLAVFASKADENRMTSQNLAAIFQPGLLSHPQHDMAPAEYRLSQDVIVFLIEQQDSFLIGMKDSAADEQTLNEIQNGTPPISQPSTPTPSRGKNSIVRSASNASAGADSVRRGGGVRRNVSVNSRHSRQSNGAPSPASPAFGTPLAMTPASGVHRSNTVPSKKSPALPSSRLQRNLDAQPTSVSAFASMSPTPSQPLPATVPAPIQESSDRLSVESPDYAASSIGASTLTPPMHARGHERSQERLLHEHDGKIDTPSKERGFPSLFGRSPTNDGGEKKQPNKLRKKRMPGNNPSAASSTNSLHGHADYSSPLIGAMDGSSEVPEQANLTAIEARNPVLFHTEASPPISQDHQQPILAEAGSQLQPRPDASHHSSDGTLKPQPSSTSLHSGDVSATDQSDLEHTDDPVLAAEQKEKRRRWRLSRKRDDAVPGSYLTSPKKSTAENSTSSFGSGKPRKSFTGDEHKPSHASQTTFSDGSSKEDKRQGPIGWIKDKMREAKDEMRLRDPENQSWQKRGSQSEASTSTIPLRGKSVDIKREPDHAAPIVHTSMTDEGVTAASVGGQTAAEVSSSTGIAQIPLRTSAREETLSKAPQTIQETPVHAISTDTAQSPSAFSEVVPPASSQTHVAEASTQK